MDSSHLSFENSILNPLAPVSGKHHCSVIFVVLILSLIVVLFTLFSFLGSFFVKTKNATIFTFMALIQVVLIHHVYRIIYSMCLNSV